MSFFWLAARTPDRYARFFLLNRELLLERGAWSPADRYPRTPLGTSTLCSNVLSCAFAREQESVQMVLKLDNGSQAATIVSSAVMHN